MPENTVVATNQGGGYYSATGIYTPMVGRWNVHVDVAAKGKDPHIAFFALPGQAKPLAAKARAPPIHPSTWEYGIAEVLLVVCGLIAANLVSRFIASRLRQRTTTTP